MQLPRMVSPPSSPLHQSAPPLLTPQSRRKPANLRPSVDVGASRDSNASSPRGSFLGSLVSPAGRKHSGTFAMSPTMTHIDNEIATSLVKQAVLQKLRANDNFWISRRVLLTEKNLFFGDANSSRILDKIPLHEVVRVIPSEMSPQASVTNPIANLKLTQVKEQPKKPGATARMMRSRSQSFISDDGAGILDGKVRKPATIKNVDSKDQNILEIHTAETGYNSGRTYFLAASSEEERDEWLELLKLHARLAFKTESQQTALKQLQMRTREVYNSPFVQYMLALAIFGNFVSEMSNAQLNPDNLSSPTDAFLVLEILFTSVFTLEICVNLFAHGVSKFFRNGWSVFDLVIVIVSLLAIGLQNLPGVTVLRVIKVFKILRVFGRLHELRRIVNSLSASILPVLNAFLIVLVTMSLYAILGVNFFNARNPAKFSSFFNAFVTMFEVTTVDGWMQDIVGPMMEEGRPDFLIVLFFTSYIFVVVWTLLPVVVAILIENFTIASREERQREAAIAAQNAAQFHLSSVTALDPLLESLAYFESSPDLSKRIDALFNQLDTDGKDSLSFNDLNVGLKKLSTSGAGIHLSKEDFDVVTEHGQLLDVSSELNRANFETLVRHQLDLFTQRQLATMMESGNSQYSELSPLLAALKLLLTRLPSEFAVDDAGVSSASSPGGVQLRRGERFFSDGPGSYSSRVQRGGGTGTKKLPESSLSVPGGVAGATSGDTVSSTLRNLLESQATMMQDLLDQVTRENGENLAGHVAMDRRRRVSLPHSAKLDGNGEGTRTLQRPPGMLMSASAMTVHEEEASGVVAEEAISGDGAMTVAAQPVERALEFGDAEVGGVEHRELDSSVELKKVGADPVRDGGLVAGGGDNASLEDKDWGAELAVDGSGVGWQGLDEPSMPAATLNSPAPRHMSATPKAEDASRHLLSARLSDGGQQDDERVLQEIRSIMLTASSPHAVSARPRPKTPQGDRTSRRSSNSSVGSGRASAVMRERAAGRDAEHVSVLPPTSRVEEFADWAGAAADDSGSRGSFERRRSSGVRRQLELPPTADTAAPVPAGSEKGRAGQASTEFANVASGGISSGPDGAGGRVQEAAEKRGPSRPGRDPVPYIGVDLGFVGGVV